MSEMILYTNTLPKPLLQLIPTEKVKIREVNGEIRLTPINETGTDCPILGMYSDGKLTVDTLLKQRLKDMELEPYRYTEGKKTK